MSEKIARDFAYDVINDCKETIPDKQSPCPTCIALAIMQAEERGRRSAETERDELRKLLRDVRPLVNETWLNAGPMTERGWEYLLGRIDAAIALLGSTPPPMEGAPCIACGAAFGTHANWCHQLNATNNALAPRDSGKEG